MDVNLKTLVSGVDYTDLSFASRTEQMLTFGNPLSIVKNMRRVTLNLVHKVFSRKSLSKLIGLVKTFSLQLSNETYYELNMKLILDHVNTSGFHVVGASLCFPDNAFFILSS